MFTSPCRFQNSDDKQCAVEVDHWGHGVRIRILRTDLTDPDEPIHDTRSVFLDATATATLARRLSQYVGMADTISNAAKRAQAMDLISRAFNVLAEH